MKLSQCELSALDIAAEDNHMVVVRFLLEVAPHMYRPDLQLVRATSPSPSSPLLSLYSSCSLSHQVNHTSLSISWIWPFEILDFFLTSHPSLCLSIPDPTIQNKIHPNPDAGLKWECRMFLLHILFPHFIYLFKHSSDNSFVLPFFFSYSSTCLFV